RPILTRHVFTCQPGWEDILLAELRGVFPGAREELIAHGWVATEPSSAADAGVPCVTFAGQCLPDAVPISASSISQWAAQTTEWMVESLGGHDGRWRLHVFNVPVPAGPVGPARCRLIEAAIAETLRKKRRRLWRALVAEPNAPATSDEALVQVGLVTAGTGYGSCCLPDRWSAMRRCASRFAGGTVTIPPDRRAPSRAFAKLAEVEIRLGRRIAADETCIDLGSSPGSWAWLALARGARVTAVDRSPLRADLVRHARMTFIRGDAFRYRPAAPVDWLLCDVIAFPSRTIELLRIWLTQRWCRWFCVTIKFRGADEYGCLQEIKSWLAARGVEFFVRRLTSNKNEAVVFGCVDSSIQARL
ncbi:MAG TPA: SAM-dependent methyltransferase, partial [Pirellulales bacterium]|nr:SAM-dependent methyltransferase [Pirellulales bacterium]